MRCFPRYWSFVSGHRWIPLIQASNHDDVIKWKQFPRYRPFVRGIHRSPVNSPHKGQCRGALMFSLTCAWLSGWVNNLEAGDLRRHRAHCDVNVMVTLLWNVFYDVNIAVIICICWTNEIIDYFAARISRWVSMCFSIWTDIVIHMIYI